MLILVSSFVILASVKAQDWCGGEIRVTNDTVVTSPGYPKEYPPNRICTWDIIALPDQKIAIQFTDFVVESCSNCICDHVHVSSILSDYSIVRHTIRRCNAESYPLNTTSEGNHLRIKFVSNHQRNYKGFKAIFSVIGSSNTKSEESLSKDKNVQWFLKQIKGIHGLELPRASLALFLAEPGFFASDNSTATALRDSVTINILAQISRNEAIQSQELALYVQALLVTCQDPRDFYGHDLLSELRSRVDASSTFVNPFEILALCNVGAEVTAKDVERVSAAFDSQHRPFWIDIQAIATMAMQCLSSHVAVDERVIKDMQDELKTHQFRNGTVENLVTTALVVQALNSNSSSFEFFDITAALDVLLKAQNENGSWGNSVRNSFYILPAISKKSFLDINNKHCPKKTENEEESLARLQKTGGDKFVVQYSVWIGGDVDLGRTWRVRVQSNKTTTFYDILEMVSKLDNKHKVSYQVVDRKPYVRSLLGKEEDPEMCIFWFTYVRSTSSKAPPTLVESSPVDINVIPNQELILWYKSSDWNSKV